MVQALIAEQMPEEARAAGADIALAVGASHCADVAAKSVNVRHTEQDDAPVIQVDAAAYNDLIAGRQSQIIAHCFERVESRHALAAAL